VWEVERWRRTFQIRPPLETFCVRRKAVTFFVTPENTRLGGEMKMKKLLTGAALLLTLAASGAPALAQAGPETVVANLYRAATAKSVAGMSKTQLRKYFDEGLADDIWKAARGEEGLGFDLLYHAQDRRVRNFRIGKYEGGGPFWGWVTVSFTNFGERQKIDFKVTSADAGPSRGSTARPGRPLTAAARRGARGRRSAGRSGANPRWDSL
jgi:hypothetical protein